MYRFFECKYSFKVTFLLRKLEFYTRVHKKINYKSITVCIKSRNGKQHFTVNVSKEWTKQTKTSKLRR